MHTNKNKSPKTKKIENTDKNDDENEMCVDEGQGFTDRNIFRNHFDSIRTDQILLSDEWIPGEGDLKDIDKSLEKLPEMKKSLDGENNQTTILCWKK